MVRQLPRDCNQVWAVRAAYALALLSLTYLGCSPAAPKTTSQDDAESILKTALDHWSQGQPISELKDITISDPRWEAGWKLASYSIAGHEAQGYQFRIRATLQLVQPSGAKLTEAAEYVVAASPRRVVVRSSEGW